jgi:hypothetical protein
MTAQEFTEYLRTNIQSMLTIRPTSVCLDGHYSRAEKVSEFMTPFPDNLAHSYEQLTTSASSQLIIHKAIQGSLTSDEEKVYINV